MVFQKVPPAGQLNLPPSAGYQFFGEMSIEAASRDMIVVLKHIDGKAVFSQQLQARAAKR